MKAFTYASGEVPPEYKCSKCGAHGCKLWRQWNTFVNHIQLLCGPCALADEKKKGPIDERGRVLSRFGDMIDQIGGLAPAVPTEEGDTFWGYTSVPRAGCEWWRALPSYPEGWT